MNPAIVGTGLYQHRIQSGLRSQFVGGDNLYSTLAVGWDTKINNKQSDIKNYMGIGFNILSDRLMAGVIQNNFISLNLAYHIYLDQNQKLIFHFFVRKRFFHYSDPSNYPKPAYPQSKWFLPLIRPE